MLIVWETGLLEGRAGLLITISSHGMGGVRSCYRERSLHSPHKGLTVMRDTIQGGLSLETIFPIYRSHMSPEMGSASLALSSSHGGIHPSTKPTILPQIPNNIPNYLLLLPEIPLRLIYTFEIFAAILYMIIPPVPFSYIRQHNSLYMVKFHHEQVE